MRREIAIALVFLAIGTFAAVAQEEVPIKPKAPTANQAKMLALDAARTASKLGEIEEKLKEVDEQFTVAKSSITVHNAQYGGGQCTYTEQNPSACDGWIAEANELNTRMTELTKQKQAQLFRRAELKGNLSMRLARLRMMKMLEGLTEWEQEVVACSQLKSDADRGCLIAAWERHP